MGTEGALAEKGFSDAEWLDSIDRVIARCMPESTRKQDRSRQREKEILREALRVFARDGLSSARISDIAAEAGIPISTIYEYYSGKEEIAHAVPVAHLCRFFQEYRALSEKKSTAYDHVWNYLHLSADFARRNPDWARSLYLEIWPSVSVAQGEIKELFDDYVRILIRAIRMGEVRGEWPAGHNHYETAAVMIGAVNQMIITWLMMRKPKDLSKSVAAMLDRAMILLDPVNPPPSRA